MSTTLPEDFETAGDEKDQEIARLNDEEISQLK
jgi:hypothetical protein